MIINIFFPSSKILCFFVTLPSIHPTFYPHSHVNSDLLSVTICYFPLLQFYINRIIYCIMFCFQLPSHSMILRFTMFLCISVFHSFQFPSNITFYGYPSLLIIHQLMNIWAVSSLGLIILVLVNNTAINIHIHTSHFS